MGEQDTLPFALDADGSSGAGSDRGATPDPPEHATPAKDDDVDLCRRVIQLIEVSDDCCSICLDEYTKADPGVPTTCGHSYHLQCVMQWAQRSRECPLCFHSLQLKDDTMNELLPFGEYVSPEQQAMGLVNVESWELERLLIRLAAANQRHERRAARHQRRQAAARAEASAPQPIARESYCSGSRRTDPGHAGGGAGSDDESTGRRPASSPGTYPSSWPPAVDGTSTSGRQGSGSGSRGLFGMSGGEASSPQDRPGTSLKSKFAALRLKESLSKTTREIKSLFSPSGGGGRQDRGSAGAGSSTSSSVVR